MKKTTKKLKNHKNVVLVINKDDQPWVQGNKECIEKFPFLEGVDMHNINPKGRVGIFPCKRGTLMAEKLLGAPNGTELPIYITDEKITSENGNTYYRAALIMDFFTITKAKADK